MTDIVERLRWWAYKFCGKGAQEDDASDVMTNAIHEIERLRKNFATAEHEMKVADQNRMFFQKEYERWMNMSQELNDYTIKLEEAIFNYVNTVMYCEGVTFIDGLDDEWAKLICDVWKEQRKKMEENE
jgi:hypothetical protein